ncbi:tumor necrosis factor-like isoform X2 [Montipora capricornis]
MFSFCLLMTTYAALTIKSTSASTTGTCANPGIPININVGNCVGPAKPSAHIEAKKGDATYGNNQVIQDWSVNAPNSHIAGGMTYKDGKLTVPTPGRYYIYAQFYYHHTGRINLRVNNNIITMLQPPAPHRSGSHGGALYAGGVFQLNAGDVITLLATSIHGTVRGHMNPFHSYFGAFLI